MKVSRRLILQHPYALGDTVLLTGLARDIHATYPGRFELLIDSHFREVWDHNPHARLLRRADAKDGVPTTRIWVSYAAGIRAAGRGQRVHMLSWYHRDFATKTGLELQPLLPKGDLHLTAEESKPLIAGRYWVILAGGKLDITCKWWPPAYWQQAVDRLAELGVHCVQTGATHAEHRHPKLQRVTDTVGAFQSSRQFFNLIKHADGVICPVTAAMHIAACYDKPCVVISGGREEPWWEAYTDAYGAFGPKCAAVKTEHRFLHTIGLLDCCQTKGCWKHRTVPLAMKDKWDAPDRRCRLPVAVAEAATPKCMEMVKSDHVVEAVMSYYERGEIPPIGQPRNDVASPLTPQILAEAAKRVPNLPVPHRRPLLPEIPDRIPTQEESQLPRLLTLPGRPKTQITEFKSAVTPGLIHHPLVGGRFTVFVLCFGPHPDLAKACIDSICSTLPAACMDLRVGLNAVAPQTRAYVERLREAGYVSVVYDRPENAKKYPLMRQMFHDPEHPIVSKYVVWLDDDAKVVVPTVWSELCNAIVANHPQGSRMFGSVFVHDLLPYERAGGRPREWFKQARWWRGRDLKVRGRGNEAPNGTVIDFASGWFWALAADVIHDANVPCPRLNHNGGDITIGEQVHQLGYKVKGFNENKKWVWCPSRENGGRRGYREDFPWAKEQ